MEPLVFFIVFCQALGAATGAFFAILAERDYIRAMRDGKIDSAERAHLDHIARALRFGMTILLTASFALVVAAYLGSAAVQPALSPGYWTLVVLALLIISISWALSRGRVSFALGSATIFTAWWFLVYLTLGQIPFLPFGANIAFFVVATAIFYGLLHFARHFSLRKR